MTGCARRRRSRLDGGTSRPHVRGSAAGRADGVELRDALRRRPVTPERRIAIREAMLRIEELGNDGDDATAAIETLNETISRGFGLDDFHHHCGAPDREQLVEWACAPPPVRLPDVTRDERVGIVHRIIADPTDDWCIEAFECHAVMPGASGLMFHPPPELMGRDGGGDRRRRAGLPPDRPMMRNKLDIGPIPHPSRNATPGRRPGATLSLSTLLRRQRSGHTRPSLSRPDNSQHRRSARVDPSC